RAARIVRTVVSSRFMEGSFSSRRPHLWGRSHLRSASGYLLVTSCPRPLPTCDLAQRVARVARDRVQQAVAVRAPTAVHLSWAHAYRCVWCYGSGRFGHARAPGAARLPGRGDAVLRLGPIGGLDPALEGRGGDR